MAVLPSLHDPRLNTVECVITGHDKAPNFGGLKQLLHGVSWSILSVSLVMHMFASQSLILQLKKWSEENYHSKIAAVMLLTVFVFIGGIALSIYALWVMLVTNKYKLYTTVFLGGVVIVFLRRCAWCIRIHRERPTFDLISGHDKPTSKNFFSWVTLYPAVFIACHHVLWIFLGIVTEPFWGITVLVAVLCVSFALYFLSYQFHRALELNDCCNTVMVSILIITGFFAFVLLIMVLMIVSQVFLSESLISTVVQNGAVVVATYWFKHYREEGGRGGRGGGGEVGGEGGGAQMQLIPHHP